ncbi:fructuronate reductase [Sphingomonas gellani]|uniref:Fructuronate reductase n=1 Tax=Sphingomonas gellani TaxID=1166340 RepID=A0A1H8INL7_9SPHN|nr:mannitol dehydrogenase family protein [Sphingomonas gellani]SEN69248.1 fructuronate reductase [Sphingomonas gellani]
MTDPRLSARTLARVSTSVARPAYDRAAVRRGVVHLGIGAFHRAHGAAVFEAALNNGDLRWGITAVSLRSAGVRDQMMPQDALYSVLVRDGTSQHVRVVGAVAEVLVAPENPAAVVAALAHPDTRIVTLTITEKGYRLDRASGGLMVGDADVAADLADLTAPRTAAGFLVAGLAARRAADLAPFTVISCDNLSDNGALLRRSVVEIARAHDAALADWIARHGAFPDTMVDRIVPATTDDDIAASSERIGVEDRAMVKTEPFSQWVIEDRFAGARPDFAALGVQLTQAVAPWEATKLRLLNGAHSGIAYLGGLAGDAFVHQFVARPAGRRFVEMLWDEAQATLDPPSGLDIAAYRAALMTRFANAALEHRTHQIASDGSQKLPQRLIEPIRARRAAGQPIEALALAVAAWMRWQDGSDDAGGRFVVDDPLADRLAAARRSTAGGVDALLDAIGADLDAEARAVIARQLRVLTDGGALPAIRRLTGTGA